VEGTQTGLVGKGLRIEENEPMDGDTLLEFLRTRRNIRKFKTDPVSGELRTRSLSIIAGEKRTITTHTEYGLLFDVDVRTTYFSPRLASERKRIANLVKPGETIVDMFTGVAPFSIMIARYAKPNVVYVIDKKQQSSQVSTTECKAEPCS
jgi:tRNA (guanine37-N1)-methyltransferase